MNEKEFFKNVVFFSGLSLIFSLLFLVFFSFHVSAATQSTGLPYVPNDTSYTIDSGVLSDLATAVEYYCHANSLDTPQDLGYDSIFIYCTPYSGWYDYTHTVNMPKYEIYYFDSSTLPVTLHNNGNDFIMYSQDYLIAILPEYYICSLSPRTIGNLYNGYTVWEFAHLQNNTSKVFYGQTPPQTETNSIFTFQYSYNYPIYTNSDFYFNDPSHGRIRFLAFARYVSGDVIPFEPDEPLPLKPQRPDINDYEIDDNDIPPLDTTDIPSLLESLWNLLKWLFKNSLFSWFYYLGETIGYWIGSLIYVVSSGFGNISENIGNFFKPILTSIDNLNADILDKVDDIKTTIETFFQDYSNAWSRLWSLVLVLYSFGLGADHEFHLLVFLTNLIVPDATSLANTFIAHDNFDMIPTFQHLFNEIKYLYTALQGYSTHLIKTITTPTFTFMDKTFPSYTIDFSWFDDFKVFSDTIVSTFLILGYVWFLWCRLAGILNHTHNPAP